MMFRTTALTTFVLMASSYDGNYNIANAFGTVAPQRIGSIHNGNPAFARFEISQKVRTHTRRVPTLQQSSTNADGFGTTSVIEKRKRSLSANEDLAERLRAQAAKLRAEAAKLESEQAEQLAKAAQRAFDSFDTNRDGTVSLDELKAGLEKQFQMSLDDGRVQELMKTFDASGDNVLQREEFVTVDKFRNKLEDLVRQEKDRARKAKAKADAEREAAKLAEARLELLNDSPPTNADKALSVLPYLFPLLDGLQYGQFLLTQADQSNPAIVALAILYTIYRSIPLSGFVAYLALNFLSFNPRLNRLVRFNMQQAIFVDIAMILPGLLLGLGTAALPALGVSQEQTASIAEVVSDGVFVTLLATLAYTTISSLLGQTPNKLPFISNAVNDRMPTIDMFDDEGRFIGPSQNEKKDDPDDNKRN